MLRKQISDAINGGEAQHILWWIQQAKGFSDGTCRAHPAKNHRQTRRIQIGHATEIKYSAMGGNHRVTFCKQGFRIRYGHRSGNLDTITRLTDHFFATTGSIDLFLACKVLIRPSMPPFDTSVVKELR